MTGRRLTIVCCVTVQANLESLDQFAAKTFRFLNKTKFPYLVIGGLAAGVIGEPRFTYDIDIDIVLAPEALDRFLEQAQTAGFRTDTKSARRDMQTQGAFRITGKEFHVDFIVASTELEREAISRAQTKLLHGVKAAFPTPEDLVLLKVIPGRPQDLLDIDRIVRRHRPHLDEKYLLRWAQWLSDQAEDLRIYNTVFGLLRNKEAS